MQVRETDRHGEVINEYEIESVEAWKLNMVANGAESIENPDPQVPNLFKVFYGFGYWEYIFATVQEETDER